MTAPAHSDDDKLPAADGADGGSAGAASDVRFVVEHGLAATVASTVEPIIEHLGFRLVRVTLTQRDGQTLQIMAERPDGTISAGDCETISHEVSPVLDVLDPLADAYRLEISSPGIDRPLVRPSDFENWAGYEARIELKDPIAGRKRFRGVLDGFAEGEVRIEVDVPDADGKPTLQVIGLPISYIGDARLIMTDDLIRETLRRSKALGRADDDAVDGADMSELPADVEVRGVKRPAAAPRDTTDPRTGQTTRNGKGRSTPGRAPRGKASRRKGH